MAQRTCPGCRKLQRRVAELEGLVRDLQARLGQNASNSSLPPSANPPDAPKPVVKTPTGRRPGGQPGGQPGHDAHLRERLPSERLTEPTVYYFPDICELCQDDLPHALGPDDP